MNKIDRAQNQMIIFTLPASFDPLEFLQGPRLQMHADDARWLVSTIVRKLAHRDTDPWGCVRLHSSILYRVMDKRHVGEIVKALERGAIETFGYCAGVKSKGYRLASRYLGDRHIRRPATDTRLVERIERERQKQKANEQKTRWKPIHHWLNDQQRHLDIQSDADAILGELPYHTRLCQSVLVGNIRRREYPFSVSTTGRCFNAITGLKRELRTALRIDGEPVGSLDIKCAQPALLALMIDSQFPTNGVKKRETYKDGAGVALPVLPAPGRDFPRFRGLACDGSLYDELVRLSGFSRDAVKLRLWADVLARRRRYPSEIERLFKREFPTVYHTIRTINRDDHSTLIRMLQRLESQVVIEGVSPRLVESSCVTLHDAVYSKQSNLLAVEAAFRETFDEMDFSMSLKRENNEKKTKVRPT